MAQSQNKRERPVGYLIPDLLYNHEGFDVSEEGSNIGRQLELDSSPNVLLIAGTSLKTAGAFSLAKQMAKQTHNEKGIVVYLDVARASARLSEFVDMHIQLDVEEWSNCMLNTLGDCSFLSIGRIQERARVLNRFYVDHH